jgi:hypothetical protein
VLPIANTTNLLSNNIYTYPLLIEGTKHLESQINKKIRSKKTYGLVIKEPAAGGGGGGGGRVAV